MSMRFRLRAGVHEELSRAVWGRSRFLESSRTFGKLRIMGATLMRTRATVCDYAALCGLVASDAEENRSV